MEPSQIIDKALTDIIPTEANWCQRSFLTTTGTSCMGGAVRRAANTFRRTDPDPLIDAAEREVFTALCDVITEDTGLTTAEAMTDYSDVLATWNDEPHRTYTDIHQTMTAARLLLESERQTKVKDPSTLTQTNRPSSRSRLIHAGTPAAKSGQP